MKLEHRLSALLQLHLHSRLNAWLQGVGQRRLQDEMRIISILGFGASYIKDSTVIHVNKRSPGGEMNNVADVKLGISKIHDDQCKATSLILSAKIWFPIQCSRGHCSKKTRKKHMMTSSNGNIFSVIGPLWGEFIGHRWIPLSKASDAELLCLPWFVQTNGWENHRDAGDLRWHHTHYDVPLMAIPHPAHQYAVYCVLHACKFSPKVNLTLLCKSRYVGPRYIVLCQYHRILP